jgi:hypothetical protein
MFLFHPEFHQSNRHLSVLCLTYVETETEVEGIQGAGPQICIWGAGSPKSPDHGDNPPPPSSPLHHLLSPHQLYKDQ